MVRVVACGGFAALIALVGCKKEEPLEAFDEAGGLLGAGPENPYPMANPFPNAGLVGDDGKLALSPDQFPYGGQSDFPADVANYRNGFSPAQVSTLMLAGIDDSAFPGWHEETPGEGSVLLVDLTAGAFLPVMAELDAWKPNPGAPTLIVRPLVAIPYGHEVAVAVTTEAMPRPERFDGLVQGRFDTPWSAHYADVVDQIAKLGVKADDIALAWDFPVADGTQPTRSAVSQSQAPGPARIAITKEAGIDQTPPSIWRQAFGSFDVVKFVGNDGYLDMDPVTGDVSPQGSETATLAVAIPHSVKDAPAGSVPVLVYGHGLLGTANMDIFSSTGDFGPLKVASDLGMIVVATDWGGLDGNDFLVSIGVANDLGKFPTLAAHMVQGQANHQAMLDLVRGGQIGALPELQGADGQSLIDPSKVYYYGISMGGILGGVAMAQEGADYEAGVFHVGGAAWSSLLERSASWGQFEMLVTIAVEDPAERQLLYASSQLFWDPVDPIAYVDDLQDELILLQESINDDTVSNLATEIYARSLALPQLDPTVDPLLGLELTPADLPAGSRAFVQFDPERTPPKDKNRPADPNGAHMATSGWWETLDQSSGFLTPGSEGTVRHFCGTDACSASNRGN